MNKRELLRASALQRVIDGSLSIADAAVSLGLSIRQVKRLKKGVVQEGFSFLAHGNRGRTPSHALAPETAQRVLALATSRYAGCNFHHLRDLLAEFESIDLSVSSISQRRILVAAGIKSPKTRRSHKKHRSRPRRPQAGELVLLDGSLHHWLGKDHPQLVLLGAIDDATSTVLGALFVLVEDFAGYVQLMLQLIRAYGLPLFLYTDRHSVFRPTHLDRLSYQDELEGQHSPVSQFGRCLKGLGIHQLFSYSPQARGRIERLWQTFQDRLTKELNLAQAHTLDQANQFLQQFLPRFNRRFAVPPESPVSAFRPAPPPQELLHAFAWRDTRTLSHGCTVRLHGATLAVVDASGQPAPLKTRSRVHIFTDIHGTMTAVCGDRTFSLQPVPPAPPPAPVPKSKDAAKSKAHPPAPDHPWRKGLPLRQSRCPNPPPYPVTFSQTD